MNSATPNKPIAERVRERREKLAGAGTNTAYTKYESALVKWIWDHPDSAAAYLVGRIQNASNLYLVLTAEIVRLDLPSQ